VDVFYREHDLAGVVIRARIHFSDCPADHLLDERLGRGFGDEALSDRFAITQDGVAVGDLIDLVEEMADVDEGESLVPEFSDHAEQGLLVLSGERTGGLVHDDDPGLAYDGAGDLNNLLACDRQTPDLPGGQDIFRTQELERGFDFLRLRAQESKFCLLHPERHVLLDREMGGEGEFLVDHRDPGSARDTWACQGERSPCHFDRSGIRLVGAAQDFHERALAGTIFADQGKHLTGADVE